MAKVKPDEFLQRITPEDIEDVILPTLKADKEKNDAADVVYNGTDFGNEHWRKCGLCFAA